MSPRLAMLAFVVAGVCWPVGLVLGAWALAARDRSPGAPGPPIGSAEILAVATFGVAVAGLI